MRQKCGKNSVYQDVSFAIVIGWIDNSSGVAKKFRFRGGGRFLFKPALEKWPALWLHRL